MAYDHENIFAKILRGEIPCKKVYESDHSLAFHDINPLMPIHVLVIPKGPYESWDDFSSQASLEEQADFIRAIGEVGRLTGAVENGFRLVCNNGPYGNQEVPHLHVHLFGGRQIRARLVVAES